LSDTVQARPGHIPGEAGVWLLIFGEMSFFTALFASFLLAWRGDVAGFMAGQAELSRAIGTANTLLLLTSSLFVARGVAAAKLGDTVRAPRLFALGLGCGIFFIALKAVEYAELIGRGIAFDSHPFFAYYFGLTALHLGHVLIGSALLAALTAATRRPLSKPSHLALMESAACFWHMVDLLWIVIFPLLFLLA
jgi:nitric oxide reductase NorE protein